MKDSTKALAVVDLMECMCAEPNLPYLYVDRSYEDTMKNPLSSKHSLNILYYVRENPGCNKTDIEWFVASVSPNTLKVIRDLENAHLISVDHSPHLYGRTPITLTANGERLLKLLDEILPEKDTADL